MKIAVSGKGGVGKTLIAGILARLLGRDGYKVLALDCDSNPNLYMVLGIDRSIVVNVTPIAQDIILIEERTGARPGGSWGVLFSLTPTVDDIPDKYAIDGPDNVKLLMIGSPPYSGSGCLCPANALISELLRYIVLRRNEVVIMDMEAGFEHFGRATTKGIDLIILVTEPTVPSLDTVARMIKYVDELGIRRRWIVLNKVTNSYEVELSRSFLAKYDLVIDHVIPYDPCIAEAFIKGVSPLDYNPNSIAILSLNKLKEKVKELIRG